MGTLWLIVARFILGWNALEVADYQILAIVLSLDTIALMLLFLLRRKQA